LVFRILTTSLGEPDLLGTVGRILSVVFEWLYLVTLVSCFVLALGNRPQGSNKLYMSMVYFWVVIMGYLMFAAVFITVISIKAQIAQKAEFNAHTLFSNTLFTHLCVSMASTYALYLVMSILFFDPWHMFTSVCILKFELLMKFYRFNASVSLFNTSCSLRHMSTFSMSMLFAIPTTSLGVPKATTSQQSYQPRLSSHLEVSMSPFLQMMPI